MKRLNLKEVNELLKKEENYCIRVNELTRQIHIIKFKLNCLNVNTLDETLGYLTFNQFIKLDMTNGLIELPINSYIYDYYTLK